MKTVSRRGLVAALAGSGLALGASGRALAFSESADARLEHLRAKACGASTGHGKLLAEAELMLGEKLGPDEKRVLLAKLTCPVCGCPLTGTF